MSGDDADALRKALSQLARDPGEPDAWRELHRLVSPLVLGLLYRWLGDASHVEDAAQEVFLKLARYGSFADLVEPKRFRAYLWSLCRNTARDYWRRRLRDAEAPLGEEPVSREATAEESAEVRESLERIFGHLDAVDRELLRLVLRGATLKEVAAQLRISYANAGVRVHRLREGIRGYLESQEAS